MLFILDFVDKNVNNIHLKKFSEVKVKFQLTPMGVLAPGSTHVRPSTLHPTYMSRNFLVHASAESPSNILSEVLEP